jgi:conjugative transfer signal peptidase TraF
MSMPLRHSSPPPKDRFSPAKIPAPLPLLLALLGIFAFLAPRTLRVNVTPSLPLGLYRVLDESITHGSLVEICPPPHLTSLALVRGYTGRGLCPGGARPLLKTALALPGDRLVLTRLGVFFAGTRVPSSTPRPEDSRGRRLSPLPLGLHTVPPQALWLHASHPLSFDSRYFGPVSLGSVRQTLRPLLTMR